MRSTPGWTWPGSVSTSPGCFWRPGISGTRRTGRTTRCSTPPTRLSGHDENPRTHRGLAHVLAEAFADELTGDEMASFRSAQEIREESDYVTGTDPDAEDVRTVLEDAERFVARAEEILESV